MRAFKDELCEAILHPGRLPGNELSDHVQHDYGSDEAFMEQLWRYLYGTGPVAGPGVPGASQRAARPEGAALLYESVRTVTPVKQTGYDGQLIQVIPAGTEGIIRHTRPDGTHTAELVTAPQPEDHGDDDFDGGFVDVTLTDGQYEVIPSLCRNWTLHAGRPFSALIAIADAYLAPGADDLASLRQQARREGDQEMRRFKDQLRELILHPERLPDRFFSHLRHDCGSDEAFTERLWRYLYGGESAAEPGTADASRKGAAGA